MLKYSHANLFEDKYVGNGDVLAMVSAFASIRRGVNTRVAAPEFFFFFFFGVENMLH